MKHSLHPFAQLGTAWLVLGFFQITVLLFVPAASAVPINFDPGLYSFFTVANNATFGKINNLGEIVYVQQQDARANAQVFSTERGQLTSSTTQNLGSPDINNLGEVVYQDVSPLPGFRVFSTEQGLIDTSGIGSGQAGIPAINDFGEISFTHSQNEPRGVYTTDRGLLTPFSLISASTFTDINNSGEVIHGGRDSDRRRHIYSTDRGQLTFSSMGNSGISAAINNFGDVVYTRNIPSLSNAVLLFSLDGTQLTNFAVFSAGIGLNDFGDIVFGVGNNFGTRSSIILMTQRPDFFSSSGFTPFTPPPPISSVVPEPSTILLFGTGLAGLGLWRYRKRVKL